MKTAKELKDIYIRILMNTCSEQEYRQELERLNNIVGAHPNPQRSAKQSLFVDFVENNIYLNNTDFAWLQRLSNGKIKEPTDSDVIKFFGNYEIAKTQMNKIHKETSRRINSYFEKYRIELNEILIQ